MSFASVKSQQFGRVVSHGLGGSTSATVGEIIFQSEEEGPFIYSLTLLISISGTTFGTSTIKIGTNLYTAEEKIINVLKSDAIGATYYTYNMSGVADSGFDIYLYASSHTSPFTQHVTWIGTLELIKVVQKPDESFQKHKK